MWLLSLAYPALGDQPIAGISAPEVLSVLKKVEARGRYETAKRVRSTCGQVFRYAISTGRAQRDPTIDLRGALTAPKVKHRAAVTNPAAIGALLRAIEGYEGQPVTLAALRLAPLVFVRPGELRNAEWSEFDFHSTVHCRYRQMYRHRGRMPRNVAGHPCCKTFDFIERFSASRTLLDVARPTCGAARGIRTPDPVITNDVLYRLSYCG